jgi:hypothetical protein
MGQGKKLEELISTNKPYVGGLDYEASPEQKWGRPSLKNN